MRIDAQLIASRLLTDHDDNDDDEEDNDDDEEEEDEDDKRRDYDDGNGGRGGSNRFINLSPPILTLSLFTCRSHQQAIKSRYIGRSSSHAGKSHQEHKI